MLEEQLFGQTKTASPKNQRLDPSTKRRGGKCGNVRPVSFAPCSEQGCFQSRKDMYSNSVIHITPNLGKVSIKFNHVNPRKTLPHVIFAFMSAYLSQGGNDCTKGRGGGGLQLRGDFDERLDAGETFVLIRRVKQQSLQDMNIIRSRSLVRRSRSLVRCHPRFRECNW